MKTTEEMKKRLPEVITIEGVEYRLGIRQEEDGLWFAEYVNCERKHTLLYVANQRSEKEAVEAAYDWVIEEGYTETGDNVLQDIEEALKELAENIKSDSDTKEIYIGIAANSLRKELLGRGLTDFMRGLAAERAEVMEKDESFKQAKETDTEAKELVEFCDEARACYMAWVKILDSFDEKLKAFSTK